MTAAILAAALALGARAEAPPVGPAGPVTAEQLMKLGQTQLDELMAKSEPGPLPDGAAVGIANLAPGTCFGRCSQSFFSGLWEGKTFDRASGTLTNRTAIGDTGSAKVYHGVSRVDGKPCIILDYSKSDNLLARKVHDELRLVAPGLYLGIAYLKIPTFHKWLYFALQFPAPNPAP